MLKCCVLALVSMSAAAIAADIPAVPVAPSAVTAPAAQPVKPIVVTANKDVVTPWSGEKIVCTRVAPVGSLIAVRHCTTKSTDEQNQRNAREILGRPINSDLSN